jgi:hypothetical protein
VSGSELEHALVAAAHDPAARPAFYRTLLKSEVYFIIPKGPRLPVVGQQESITLVSFQGPQGRFTPMFSTRERLEAALAARDGDFAILSLVGREAFAILAESRSTAVLNPGTIGKAFSPEEISMLAEGRIDEAEHVVPAGRKIMLGHPQEPPTGLLEALCAHARSQPAIEALYFAQLHDPESGEPPHPVIGVDAVDVRALIPALSEAASAAYSALPVDFVSTGKTDGIAEYLRQTEPFYRRLTKM